MKIYLAGPMTGKPDLNFPAFRRKAYELRRRGFEVFNPAEHEMETYRDNMKIDLAWICDNAEGMYMLKGWEFGPGAVAEHALGKALKLEFMYE